MCRFYLWDQNAMIIVNSCRSFRDHSYGFCVRILVSRLEPGDIYNISQTFPNVFCVNENVLISMNISLRFISKGPTNNILALVQIVAWCRPATSHYLNQLWLMYRRRYASLGLDELALHHLSHCYLKSLVGLICFMYLWLVIMKTYTRVCASMNMPSHDMN